MDAPDDDRLLRPKQLELWLGLSRHTLRRIALRDPDFPRFIEVSPRVRFVRAGDVRRWLRRKELNAAMLAPFARRDQ